MPLLDLSSSPTSGSCLNTQLERTIGLWGNERTFGWLVHPNSAILKMRFILQRSKGSWKFGNQGVLLLNSWSIVLFFTFERMEGQGIPEFERSPSSSTLLFFLSSPSIRSQASMQSLWACVLSRLPPSSIRESRCEEVCLQARQLEQVARPVPPAAQVNRPPKNLMMMIFVFLSSSSFII